jgi:hypothetical protein
METLLQTYQIIYAIMGIGLLITATEYAAKTQIFSKNGILSCDLQQLNWRGKYSNPLLRKLLSTIFNEQGLKYLFLLRCVNIILLFLIPLAGLTGWLLLFTLGLNIYISSTITHFGSDGSDQMSILIVITFIFCLSPLANSTLRGVGIWFIAFQSCLSYAAAGISKLASAEWRSSKAVKSIFSTKTYGTKKVALLLKNNHFLNVFICWNVMITETLFPLCLILPFQYGIIFLIWGFTFHLFSAVIMGLNSFFWAFMATYPAIIYVNLHNYHSFK